MFPAPQAASNRADKTMRPEFIMIVIIATDVPADVVGESGSWGEGGDWISRPRWGGVSPAQPCGGSPAGPGASAAGSGTPPVPLPPDAPRSACRPGRTSVPPSTPAGLVRT